MASIVDICNIALSNLGSRAQITSISPPDGTVEAGYCARFYPIARKEALDQHTWTWSKKRVLLASAANPSDTWLYAYALPSDCLSPLRVIQQSIARDIFSYPFGPFYTVDDFNVFTERGSANFQVEGDVLLTNEPDAVLLYTRDITDTTKFSASFTTYLADLLSAYLAGPIVKGENGAKTSATWRKVAAQVMKEAAVQDANGSSERAEHTPDHMRARQ